MINLTAVMKVVKSGSKYVIPVVLAAATAITDKKKAEKIDELIKKISNEN